MPTEGKTLAERLSRLIDQTGPISIATYMAEANAHYYDTRDPFGAQGDFITAPEISQMFGELVGIWCADLWLRAGKPLDVHYIELGPGRGTMAKDALRTMAQMGFAPTAHFVDTSLMLRIKQAEAVPDVIFHDSIESLPKEGALIVIANEFFDALPIRQMVNTSTGWRERLIARHAGDFIAMPGPTPVDAVVPDALRRQSAGAIVEISPTSCAIVEELGHRIAAQGGALLAIDYGYEGPRAGNTLQAVRHHETQNFLENVGEADLTAHVDFAALASCARRAGVRVLGPVDQGSWLKRLGIESRAAILSDENPARAVEIAGQVRRLTVAMAQNFKVIGAYAPSWPTPEGFAD